MDYNETMRMLATSFVVLLMTVVLTTDLSAQSSGGFRGDRGGDRGGDRESFRGRSGFDPSRIVERFDANKNGKLDPDEVDGRSRMFLERFAPGVDLSKPISLSELRKRMGRGRDSERRGSQDRRDRQSGESPEMEPLVPGFGEVMDEIVLVPGFGTLGEFFDVSILPSDEKETDDVFQRYDRNRDGFLDRDELRRGNWFDDPTAYDQNRDGRLSKREMAVRYARRRMREGGKQDGDDEKREEKDKQSDEATSQKGDSDRKSYRFLTAHERLPDDVPDWFKERDANLDGQVSLAEYWSEEDLSSIDAFNELDLNRDGLITPRESMGIGAAASGSTATAGGSPASNKEEIPERYLKYATSYVNKYDKDGDGKLSKKEMESMRRKPKDADRNGDAKVSPREYALYLMPDK